MDDDDEKWSRDGSKDEEASPELEVLVEAEAILEGQPAPTVWEKTEENPTYDIHLKFIGKKLSDISHNLNQTNENLWWLSLGVKTSIASSLTFIGFWMFWNAGIDGDMDPIWPVVLGLFLGIFGLVILLFLAYEILRKFSEEILGK